MKKAIMILRWLLVIALFVLILSFTNSKHQQQWVSLNKINIEFAEELTQTVIVQMIHTMGENGIHVTEESFIRDIGFLIEVSKGTIYRSMGIPYPTQKLLEVFINTEIDADKSLRSEVDLEQLNKFLKMCEEEEYDE